MLKDGEIKEIGTYDQLKRIENGVFNEFIGEYLDAYDEKRDKSSNYLFFTPSKLYFNF